MRLFKKILTISLVLLAPVLVYLFLKQFGTNKFEVPIYYSNGHPLKECNSGNLMHHLSTSFIENNDIQLPALIQAITEQENEFDSDLINVLVKYPEVKRFKIATSPAQAEFSGVVLDSLSYIQAINCELVLGEDRFINTAIAHKFVLVDTNGIIRGYFMVNDLDEIERLDIELDIVLNYENENK